MASGDTLYSGTALNGQPPTTGYATGDQRGSGHYVVDFDAGTDESIDFAGVLPRHYDGGGVTVSLVWMASSATSGNVVWSAAWERHQDETTDLDSDSFAAAQSATATAPAASGPPQYTDIAFTDGAQMDGLAAGESFRLRITRDADNGSDTMTGDAELLRIEVRES